jgi:hypothetical protein
MPFGLRLLRHDDRHLQELGAESCEEQGVDRALNLEMMDSLVDRETPAPCRRGSNLRW